MIYCAFCGLPVTDGPYGCPGCVVIVGEPRSLRCGVRVVSKVVIVHDEPSPPEKPQPGAGS